MFLYLLHVAIAAFLSCGQAGFDLRLVSRQKQDQLTRGRNSCDKLLRNTNCTFSASSGWIINHYVPIFLSYSDIQYDKKFSNTGGFSQENLTGILFSNQ